MKTIYTTLFVLFYWLACYPQIAIHVSVSGNDTTGDGSQQYPVRTIQKAISLSTSADSIKVSAGTYNETVELGIGDTLYTRLIGGYDPISWERNYINYPTIIDPQNNIAINNIGTRDTIDGFTIQNASEVFRRTDFPSPFLTLINNCIIRNNENLGLISFIGSMTIKNTVFQNSGSGFKFHQSGTFEIINCLFNGLEDSSSAGAFIHAYNFPSGHTVQVINSLFINGWKGILLGNYQGHNFRIYNSNFANCGTGIQYTGDTNQITIDYNNFYNNELNANISLGTNNIFFNPLFKDAANNDFRLSDFSRLIGAGNTSYSMDYDLDNNIRPNPPMSNSDIGPYENPLADPMDVDIGLVAHYPFSEMTGATLFDHSGNGNNGQIIGAMWQSESGLRGLSFNGISDYITVPHDPTFNFGTGDFTIEVQFKTNVIPTTSWTSIFSKHNTANWHDLEIFVGIEGITGRPFISLSDGTGYFETAYGSADVCDGLFHNLRGVRNGNQLSIYIDGELQATVAASINPDNANPINIGRSSYNNGYGYFEGVITNLSLWNYAKHNDVANFSFAEMTGDILIDHSGNGHNGQIIGATWQSESGLRSLSFDGTSNYVTVPHDSIFNFGTEDFTIEVQFKTSVIPTTSWSAIVSKHNTATWHDREFYVVIEGGTGLPVFGLSTEHGLFERAIGTTNVCDGLFHTITGIRKNNQLYIYVDGNLEGTASATIDVYNNNPINIGRSSYANGYGYFNGIISKVVIQFGETYYSDLVAYYPFNGNAIDESGNGNDATLITANLTTDRFGSINSAYLFDGNTMILAPTNNYPIANSDRTISVWVSSSNFGQENKMFVGWGTPGNIPGLEMSALGVGHSYSLNKKPFFWGWGADLVATKVLNDNNWNHVACTFNTGIMKIYVNGVLDTLTNLTINTPSNTTLYIGWFYDVLSGFTGSIDDIKIYKRALSDNEILELYHEGGWGLTTGWQAEINVTDAGGLDGSQILTFGQDPTATDSLDTGLGEQELPPLPPAGVFDTRFELPTIPPIPSLIDIRNDSLQAIDWKFTFQGSHPFDFCWYPDSLPNGSFYLVDVLGGLFVNVDMKTDSCVTVTNPAITTLYIKYGGQNNVSVDVDSGWNMVSAPILKEVMYEDDYYPGNISDAFKFVSGSGYLVEDTLKLGTGYWMKFADDTSYSLTGYNHHFRYQIQSGWNIIGVFGFPVSIYNMQTDPPGIVSSHFFKYNVNYQIVDTLKPGKGYWVKTSAPGKIILDPSILVKQSEYNFASISSEWNKVIVEDAAGSSMTLYVSGDQVSFELPPLPPAGIFDVRYTTENLVEDIVNEPKRIKISSAVYPVNIGVEGIDVLVKDVVTGKIINEVLKSGDVITINNPAINILEISGNRESQIPLSYELYQNYPNPFNPATTIEFSIPEDVENVKLTIYNALGQKVVELVNGKLEAGRYNYQWDASSVASGLYIYQLQTSKFTSTKKMLMLK